MKLNPCRVCGSIPIINESTDAVQCRNDPWLASCIGSGCATVIDWNKANPDIKPLQQAMLQSLMQRYAVNGKISDVGMPIYDRECLTLLEAQGVLSLSNGLYRPY